MEESVPEGGDVTFEMTAEMRVRPARWLWVSEKGKSGLRPRPQGAGEAGFDAPERDVVTAQVPTHALLEAARAMTEPEPPADLGLYRALEHQARSVEEPPRSSRVSRPAPPLATEFGLEHLLEAEGKPARNWSLWVRSHGPWIAAAVMLLWLITSFAARWLATAWP